MTKDGDEEGRSVLREKLARMLEQVGFPHSISRVYAALTMAPGEGLSTSELMEELSISKASVSNAMQFLVGTALVEKYRVPGSRETHYRMLKGVWGDILAKKFAAMSYITSVVREAKEGADSPLALERLNEMDDVYTFFQKEFESVMERWNERMGR
ncbi:MAG: hypothetical protein JXE06_08495 [Coriobacteriia bacterium]|nr:hypothetical protein [Coriobacteriia bacterium]MBN2822151.1 hypothetical protein [Coriobacteriia bacterium]